MRLDPGSKEMMRGVDVRATRLWHNARADEIAKLRVDVDSLRKTLAATYRIPDAHAARRPHPWQVKRLPDELPSGSGDPIARVEVNTGKLFWWFHWDRGEDGGDTGYDSIAVTIAGESNPVTVPDGGGILCLCVVRTPSQSGAVTNDSFAVSFVWRISDVTDPLPGWDTWIIELADVSAAGIWQKQHDHVYLRDDPFPGCIAFIALAADVPGGWEDITPATAAYIAAGAASASYEAGAESLPTSQLKMIRKL